MYTIIGTVIARPETRDELATLLAAQVMPTRAEAGCINYDFHVDAADPCVFVFYENWTSRAAWDKHMEMPHLKAFAEVRDTVFELQKLRLMTMISDPVSVR